MSLVARGARIGFAGPGNLGRPMARALVRAGRSVAVLDTASEKAEPCVARAAAGPGELAGCAVVALAVPHDAAAETVLCGSGLLGSLDAEAVVLMQSTALPETGRWRAATVAERGIGLLDAPVSGGAEWALAGELTVMVGGDVRHVRPSGAGSAAKLASQLMMCRQRESSKALTTAGRRTQ
jgi:3-hydroxyisobutyrate dehydrogenase